MPSGIEYNDEFYRYRLKKKCQRRRAGHELVDRAADPVTGLILSAGYRSQRGHVVYLRPCKRCGSLIEAAEQLNSVDAADAPQEPAGTDDLLRN